MASYADRLFGVTPVQDAPVEEPAGNYANRLLGTPTAAPQVKPAEEQQPEQGWGEWMSELYHGKHDPKYQGAGTVFEQFRDDLTSPTATAATLGASDAQMADVIAKQLGDRLIRKEKDAHGYDVFVTRGPDGQEQFGYVNAPGLDTQDLWRTAYGAVPYVIGSGAIGTATKALPGIVRAGAQALGAGSTSVAGDVAQIPMGSEQGIEPWKAAFSAGAGAASVPISAIGGALWRKLVTEPGLFNSATGKLTEKGAAAARAEGLVPEEMEAQIAKEFAKTYAKTGRASEAALKAQETEFGIKSTAGQRSKDPWQLTQEEAMRRNLYGEKARDTIQAFDRQQAEAIDHAARTRIPSDFRSNTVRESGTMDPRGITNMEQLPGTADLGAGIQTGMRSAKEAAKEGERSAWGEVGDILPRPEAFEILPDALAGRLGGMRVTNEMQKAASMARALDDYVGGKAFSEPVAGVLKQSPVKTVGEMRKQLLGMYKGATDPTDATAAKAIYDGFNDWIDEAAEKAMLAGAPEEAAKMRIARDATRVMHNLFSPAVKGRKTPAGRLMDEMSKADSPERVVQILFGPASSLNPSTIKNGSVEALRTMKQALQKYADPRIAADTIADLKLAYWSKLVQNKQGLAQSPGVMLSNIRSALSNQGTLVRELFTPAEISQMQRLAKSLEAITYKPPNASGSGYTAANLASQFFGTLMNAFGLKSVPARMLLEYSGLQSKYGAAAARRAVGAPRAPAKDLGAVVSPVGSAYERSKRENRN